MYGYIYKLTLNKDLESFKKGEVYIGKHNGVKKEYFGSGKLVKTLINKYSKDIFDRDIISKDIDNNILLSYLEVYYINLYKCNRSIYNIGLNLTEGGEGIYGYKKSDIWKEKFSNLLKEKYKCGKIRPPLEKTVYQYCLETGNLLNSYSNCIEAAKAVAGNNSSIAYCARGKCFSSYGYSWLYNKLDNYKPSIRGKRKVIQYDLEMNFIKEWDSATDIRNKLGFKNTAITNCCGNINKTSYGYIWKYKEV